MTEISRSTHAPLRLSNQLIQIIAQISTVSRIVSFGSLASNTFDAYSDVDLLIEIDTTTAAWQVSKTIRRCMPVLFYRMFSTDHQPAGRYWFKDQSPLTRLDISFHKQEMMDQIMSTGMYLGQPITSKTCYQRESQSNPITSSDRSTPMPLNFTESQTHLGLCIYRTSCAISHAMRKRPYQYDLTDCIHAISTAIAQTPPVTIASGDGHALGQALLDLARELGLHHSAD